MTRRKQMGEEEGRGSSVWFLFSHPWPGCVGMNRDAFWTLERHCLMGCQWEAMAFSFPGFLWFRGEVFGLNSSSGPLKDWLRAHSLVENQWDNWGLRRAQEYLRHGLSATSWPGGGAQDVRQNLWGGLGPTQQGRMRPDLVGEDWTELYLLHTHQQSIGFQRRQRAAQVLLLP